MVQRWDQQRQEFPTETPSPSGTTNRRTGKTSPRDRCKNKCLGHSRMFYMSVALVNKEELAQVLSQSARIEKWQRIVMFIGVLAEQGFVKPKLVDRVVEFTKAVTITKLHVLRFGHSH